MDVKILNESGYKEAMYGLGLSYGITSKVSFDAFVNNEKMLDKVHNISLKLYDMEGGHNKFLETIQVWLDVTAPRFLWSEMDTYRVGGTKQSQSTMHTLLREPFSQRMFEYIIDDRVLSIIEEFRVSKDFVNLKNHLPEGFLQKRIWCVNYKVLRNILRQRKEHKLLQWKKFCLYVYENIKYPEYFMDIMNK